MPYTNLFMDAYVLEKKKQIEELEESSSTEDVISFCRGLLVLEGTPKMYGVDPTFFRFLQTKIDALTSKIYDEIDIDADELAI